MSLDRFRLCVFAYLLCSGKYRKSTLNLKSKADRLKFAQRISIGPHSLLVYGASERFCSGAFCVMIDAHKMLYLIVFGSKPMVKGFPMLTSFALKHGTYIFAF